MEVNLNTSTATPTTSIASTTSTMATTPTTTPTPTKTTQPVVSRIRSRWLENQRRKQESQPVQRSNGWRVVQVQNVGVNENKHLKEKPKGALRLVIISDTHSCHEGYGKSKGKDKYPLSRRFTKKKLIEELNKKAAEGSATTSLDTTKEEKPDSSDEEAELIESSAGGWLPNGDVLIHTGDFTTSGQAGEVNDFIKFLDSLPHKHKVVIAGNHDICLEPEWYCANNNWEPFHPEMTGEESELNKLKEEMKKHCIFLEDDLVELKIDAESLSGLEEDKYLSIYGSPWQPEFHHWGFNLTDTREQAEKIGAAEELTMEDVAESIPDRVDVLLTHGPPLDCGKLELSRKGIKTGSKPLGKAVERALPTIHAFGHIHEAYGVLNKSYQVVVDAERNLKKKKSVTFVNSSAFNTNSRMVNNPVIIDIAPK